MWAMYVLAFIAIVYEIVVAFNPKGHVEFVNLMREWENERKQAADDFSRDLLVVKYGSMLPDFFVAGITNLLYMLFLFILFIIRFEYWFIPVAILLLSFIGQLFLRNNCSTRWRTVYTFLDAVMSLVLLGVAVRIL